MKPFFRLHCAAWGKENTSKRGVAGSVRLCETRVDVRSETCCPVAVQPQTPLFGLRETASAYIVLYNMALPPDPSGRSGACHARASTYANKKSEPRWKNRPERQRHSIPLCAPTPRCFADAPGKSALRRYRCRKLKKSCPDSASLPGRAG